MKKLLAAALFTLTGLTGFHAAHAAGYPDKPVKIVVPQAPGGASDTLARIIGQKLSERWGQPVVIENRAGAGGNIGMTAVAQSPKDGYTLLMSYEGNQAINPSLYKKIQFDAIKDFTAVATLATVPFVAVVHPSVPANDLQSVIKMAQSTQITYGSAGNGSVNHLVAEMVNQSAKVKMVHAPYKGAGPALTDLLGGQIQIVFTSLPSVAQHIQKGSLKALAVTSGKRSARLPNVPTIAESGFPGFDVNPWFGLFAPSGTPADVVKKINADINDLLKHPEVKEKFAGQGAEPLETTPEQFHGMLLDATEKWAAVVKQSGAHLD